MKWTAEQEKAIYKKNNNILVAAAAGSGKTAVLVERIIEKILKDKIDIDISKKLFFITSKQNECIVQILDFPINTVCFCMCSSSGCSSKYL